MTNRAKRYEEILRGFVTTVEGATEFEADQLDAAAAYIASLPSFVHRVYVDVKDPQGKWMFVYGDDRAAVLELLGPITRGRRFRVRGPYVSRLADRKA
jgi:hypothetical protein